MEGQKGRLVPKDNTKVLCRISRESFEDRGWPLPGKWEGSRLDLHQWVTEKLLGLVVAARQEILRDGRLPTLGEVGSVILPERGTCLGLWGTCCACG